MVTYTTRNQLHIPESEDIDFPGEMEANSEIIDERIAKCQFAGTRDPTSNDDVLDGYAVGSLWINQTDGRIFICADATGSAAQWDQIYPNDDADTLDGYHASYFAPATKGVTGGDSHDSLHAPAFAPIAKGVTNGDSHDHSGGDGAQISYSSLSNIPSSFAPSSHASNHQSGGSDSIKLDDLAAPDDTTDLDVSTSKHGLCPKAPNDTTKFLRGDGTWVKVGVGIYYTHAYRNGNQTGINTNNSAVKIQINGVVSDENGCFNTSTNRWTAPANGIYLIESRVTVIGSNILNSRYTLCIYKNGSEVLRGDDFSPKAATSFGLTLCGMLSLQKDDYLELYLWGEGNNSTNTISVVGTNVETILKVISLLLS